MSGNKKRGPSQFGSTIEIRQDMVNVIIQACHLKPSRGLAFARELEEWIFEKESLRERSMRWWACKCALLAINSSGLQADHTIDSAKAILAFVDREDYGDMLTYEDDAVVDQPPQEHPTP